MNQEEFDLCCHGGWPRGWPVTAIVTNLKVDSESPSGLSWKKSGPGRKKNLNAGYIHQETGYWRVRIGGKDKNYPCHQIVLFLSGIFPKAGQEHCDHTDRDRSNNKLENLRWVTVSDNMQNRGCYAEKKLITYPYVSWHEKRCKYLANYQHPWKNEYVKVGYFDDPLEAHEAAIAHKKANDPLSWLD